MELEFMDNILSKTGYPNLLEQMYAGKNGLEIWTAP